MAARDETVPGERWEFDAEVTEAFDDMLARSIPQYDVMRQLVTDLACSFVPRGNAGAGTVVDLGASRGEALAPIRDRLGAHAVYHAVEVSEPMRTALVERFPESAVHPSSRRWPAGSVVVWPTDLREGYPETAMADVTLCVLTLQFTPMEHRQRILRRIWQNTRPGGALLLVEKVLGATADLNDLMVKTYYDLKGENGYSPEQIERKRLSLEGVLVPCTAEWNEHLLRSAGFNEVDSVWRWSNFAAWIAIKEMR